MHDNTLCADIFMAPYNIRSCSKLVRSDASNQTA